MHNPDDLEIHLRLAKRAGPGVLGVPGEEAAVPTLLQVGTDLLVDGAVDPLLGIVDIVLDHPPDTVAEAPPSGLPVNSQL